VFGNVVPVLVGVPWLPCAVRPAVAIGSTPEYGTAFTRWGLMTDTDRAAWFEHMVTAWGGDLCGGYATLCWRNPSTDTGQETT